MHGIDLIGGHNDCWWNVRGTCVHKSTQRNLKELPKEWHRNWDSKQNCTLTQIGVQMCIHYKREPL